MKKMKILLLVILLFNLGFGQSVGINTTSPNAKAGLHISERMNPLSASAPDTYNGLMIQRYTKAERDANFTLISAQDGLTIYNKDEKCYNYYEAAKQTWVSLCGNYSKAIYTVDCANIKVFGTYTQGTALNANNYIIVPVTVSTAGTYSIIAKTSNGYYFEKTGVFPNTGTFTIALYGSGVPSAGPQTDNVTFVYEGITDATCTTVTVPVVGSQVSYTINCSGVVSSGAYMQDESLDDSNYITIPLSSVSTPGVVTISTGTNNGVTFSTTQTIDASSTSVVLKGQGIPTNGGTYTYTFTTNGSTPVTCSFNVKFTSTLGSFANPADRCYQILQADPSSKDGYFWVKASGVATKTYCDMSNGGWTLIKSYSEKQILVTDRSQNESWTNQTAKNNIITESGVFNEYNFSLASAAVNGIQNTTTTKNYRMSIKEKGQTGISTLADENTTVAPINDYWAKANYINIVMTDGNLATNGNYSSDGHVITGKLFGFSYGKPTTGNTIYQINGVNFVSNIFGLNNQSNFFTGIYGGQGSASANTAANNLTYTYPTGQTYTFNKFYINDMFGVYHNSENQLNHHIGTCSNSTNDYGGTSFCNNGWTNWRAHNFNNLGGVFEGRIVQYWVK
ncbi:MAG: hypothetical protein EOO42_19185 [Flavobacteriales bacterium]|nr:MAG: hypothetical protein EOO42_19185 [Flavobacteriales bacterium]